MVRRTSVKVLSGAVCDRFGLATVGDRMMCEKPFTQLGKAFPCGRCLPCLFNRRRVWTHRIVLEAAQYEHNTFVTLTYNDCSLPFLNAASNSSVATLVPDHLQNWLKRLRKAIAPSRLRFYACGEYGDESWRPHYHAALFGFPTCVRGRTRRKVGSGRPIWDGCCVQCELVGKTWGHGDVDLGMLEVSSAQYVAGYVTKKMTTADDQRLVGRHPEFARMSNRPGIGHSALHEVASVIMQFNLDTREGDVPVALAHGKRKLPLGRYMRRKLRALIGKEENAPLSEVQKYEEEMRPLREAAKASSDVPSFRSQILQANEGKRLGFHARRRIRERKKSL